MSTLRHRLPGARARCRWSADPAATIPLAAAPQAVPVARDLTGQLLTHLDLQVLASDARLVVSELVTNAVRESLRTPTPEVLVRLRVEHGTSVLIEVGDHGPQPPPAAPTVPVANDAPHGRGLLIVLELAAAAGWYRHGTWKIVWARISVPIPATAAPASAARHAWGRAA
jgi:anti-sigma regulatory factor (Ser/Thr protein kinase)